jgi:sortase A
VSKAEFCSLKGRTVEKKLVKSRWIRWTQILLLVAGLALVGFYGVAIAHKTIVSRAAIEEVRSNQPVKAETATPSVKTIAMPKPDFSLWSPVRVTEFKSALAQLPPAVGILRVPKLHIEAPIFEGTDDLALNGGVGHIAGTGALGSDGNTGIAGHRDGFFRGLKDVKVGDKIEIETRTKPLTYVVNQVVIVDPDDVSVLKGRERPGLTLVTCYPFYVLGSAPKRFIVEAELVQSERGT